MLLNYFKIAWRNMMKSKAFSFINIFGLAAGLTCCMLIAVFIRYETSYDSYQQDAKNIYQIATTFIAQGKTFTLAATPVPMAAAIQKDFPEVKEATRIMPMSLFEAKTMFQYKQPNAIPLSFYEDNGLFADSNVFNFFSYTFNEGSPATALAKPASVVISETIAHKLFGNSPALGKLVHISSSINGDVDFTVTGVFRKPVSPSHIDANYFLTMTGGKWEDFMRHQQNDFATNNMFVTYLRLRPDANPKNLDAKFPAFIDKYAGKDLKSVGFDKNQFLVPLRDIHLRADITTNVTPPASKKSLYILASIAVFTLLIACINFMNLATARSAKRSSEVGIRKVLGALRGSLISQFLGESVLMSIIAFGIAWALTALLLPAFQQLTGRHLTLTLSENAPMLAAFLGMSTLAGLIAGIYPAFYLSSFQPVKVLKGKFSNSLAAVSLRKGLVIFQFMISVILIISTVVINDQMHYLRDKDLGFDKTAQIVVPLRSGHARRINQSLENEFRRCNGVINAGNGAFYPGISNTYDNMLHRDGENAHSAQRVRMNYVDYTYLSTIGIKPVAGRIFSKDFPADSSNRVILNESAAKALGYLKPQDAIGVKVANDFQGSSTTLLVIGVVKDFHFEDLHLPITPYAFQLNPSGGMNYIVVHANVAKPAALLASLEKAWHSLNPGEPFEYSFLDQDFLKNYEADERLSSLIRSFTIMAILISCLGLFGLASFSAEQRIREIGIRKVLGASVGSVVFLLSKDFLKLVVIAILIASPLAWLVMHKWLQDFAYKTPISWMVFAITFISTLALTLLTIGFQAVRAGLANPVKNLKTE